VSLRSNRLRHEKHCEEGTKQNDRRKIPRSHFLPPGSNRRATNMPWGFGG